MSTNKVEGSIELGGLAPDMEATYLVAIIMDGVIARYHQYNPATKAEAWFTVNRDGAKQYTDRQEAIDFANMLNTSSQHDHQIDGTGIRYPSDTVMKALNIVAKPGTKKTAIAAVIMMQPSIILTTSIFGRVQAPTGYTYDES